MEIIIQVILITGLAWAVYTDIRERKIWIPVVSVFLLTLMVMRYCAGQGGMLLWIASIGIGSFFYLVSVVTNGKIGKGDAFLFAMTGVGLGLWENIILIYCSFLCAFVGAVYLLIIRKKERHYVMPFAPYIFVAYLIVSAGTAL